MYFPVSITYQFQYTLRYCPHQVSQILNFRQFFILKIYEKLSIFTFNEHFQAVRNLSQAEHPLEKGRESLDGGEHLQIYFSLQSKTATIISFVHLHLSI